MTLPRSLHRSARAVGLLALAAIAAPVAAQSRQIPAPPQARPILVAGATIHPVTAAPIPAGWLLFDAGVIVDLGAGAAPEVPGAHVIDATGLHLYPGLISSDTQLGLSETASIAVTQDHDERGDWTPEARAAVAVNPDSDLIPVTRANGILHALTLPTGGTVCGRAALLRLDGWTWEDLALQPDAGLVLSWPRTDPIRASWMNRGPRRQGNEIEERLEELEEFFDAAEAYFAARDVDPRVRPDLRYEAMRPALAGLRPTFIRAASASQIESAVAFALRRGLRPIILGAAEADRVLPLLARHDVPVIVGGTHVRPSFRDDAYDRRYALPARLEEAGIRFAIASGAETAHERHLNHNAATAAAYGLSREAALESVTIRPAEILGVADRLGSLEPGKSASLILTTGDPLEILTDVLVAWIDGRRIDLGSRQTALERKYREKYVRLGLLEPAPPRPDR